MAIFGQINKKTVAAFAAAVVIGPLLTVLIMKRGEIIPKYDGVSHSHETAKYSCPMHPSIISDHPAKCPICGMDLQRIDKVDNSSGTASKPKKPLFYRHPMRGEITSPVPAKDEMGMDYVPVYEDGQETEGKSEVGGRAAFSLSSERQQLIGVTTTKVEQRPLSLEIRASGKVAFDPDLFTAIEEYRQAVLSSSGMKASTYGMLKEQSDELVAAAKTRLRLLGLTDSQIQKLAQAKKSSANLILPEGNVWVYAEIFEYEVGNIKVGQTMEVAAPSVLTNIFSGKVISISPVLNPQTRTIRVRALVPDPRGVLRPDTFVNVKIKIDLGTKLAVPNDSVLHSGEQTFVFVMKDQGKFEPRSVGLGTNAGEYTEVVSGLQKGETVVTSANFLIDSESRLRAAARSAERPKKSGVSP